MIWLGTVARLSRLLKQEAELRRITVPEQPRQKVRETHLNKKVE
jgi:hypothetical protein